MSKAGSLLVDSYLSWLRGTVSADSLNEAVTELTTPFLDRHNDHLQVYAERTEQGLFLLTDDGYILAELKSSGLERRGRRREEALDSLLSGYGVTIHDSELQTVASVANLGQRLHNLIQAMLHVDDMFLLTQDNVASVFADDVARFLDSHEIRYIPKAKFAGKSGLDHLLDFVIPKSRRAPERVIQMLNSPRADRVKNLLFTITDTRANRGPETEYYALLNDQKRAVPAEVIVAFGEYDANARLWSERDEIVEALVA